MARKNTSAYRKASDHEQASASEWMRCADYKIVQKLARYIVDMAGRRDVLDEDYILERLDSVDKVKRLLNKTVLRYPAIQADAIMEDIDIINSEVSQ